ncbi:MAG: TOBE domain-containing protein, partial [Verrucomicrobiota bacterium]
MHEGRVQQVDAPLSVYRRPASRFVARFIGSPPMNLLPGRVEVRGDTVAWAGPAGALALPPPLADAGRRHPGQSAELGIRAEDFDLSPSPADPAGVLAVAVDFTEPLGAETYVHGRWGDQPLVLRLDGAAPPAAGSVLSVRPRLERAHLFAADTGEAWR